MISARCRRASLSVIRRLIPSASWRSDTALRVTSRGGALLGRLHRQLRCAFAGIRSMVAEERGFNEERAATRRFNPHQFRADPGMFRGDRARLCTHRRPSALVVLSRTRALHLWTGTHDVGVPDAGTLVLAHRPGPDRPSRGGHGAI